METHKLGTSQWHVVRMSDIPLEIPVYKYIDPVRTHILSRGRVYRTEVYLADGLHFELRSWTVVTRRGSATFGCQSGMNNHPDWQAVRKELVRWFRQCPR